MVAMVYRARKLLAGKITYSEKADGAILIAMASPVFSFMNVLFLPNFLHGKNWPLFCGSVVFLASSLLDLPPAHQCICTFVVCSFYSVLDFWQSQAPETCLTSYSLAWTILKHLCTRSFPLLVISMTASLLTVLIFLKQRRSVARLIDGKVDLSRLQFHPLFESFGLARFWNHRILSFLAWIDAVAHQLSDRIDETLLAIVFYGGLMLFFSVFIFLSRVYKSLVISGEIVICALVGNFMMGRQMSRVDVGPALRIMKNRLGLSNEVMADLLPGFVVEQIMTSSPENLVRHPSPHPQLVHGTEPRPDPHTASPIASPLVHALARDLESRSSTHLNTREDSPSGLQNSRQSFSISRRTSGHVDQRLDYQRHDSVTIFFSDIVGFSTWSHHADPEDVMATLDNLFSRLDTLIMEEMPGLYKLETVGELIYLLHSLTSLAHDHFRPSPHCYMTGDAYVVAANLINDDPVHALTAVRFALRAQQEASQVREPGSGKPLQMRIGIHTGPIVAGIVGKIRKRYCCFGDTMNMASRTETSCPLGQVQLTNATYQALLDQTPEADRSDIEFVDRGLVTVKGADEPLHMWLATETQEGFLAREITGFFDCN